MIRGDLNAKAGKGLARAGRDPPARSGGRFPSPMLLRLVVTDGADLVADLGHVGDLLHRNVIARTRSPSGAGATRRRRGGEKGLCFSYPPEVGNHLAVGHWVRPPTLIHIKPSTAAGRSRSGRG